MSQADALLASLDESTAIHSHTVSDPDDYFVIDPDTRQISNLSGIPNVLMQNDHNSEVYTFEIPRVIEGHDMLKCNRVRLHFINIDSKTRLEYNDIAELTLTVNPQDSSTLISPWTITRHATQYVGNLSLMLQYMCVDSDGGVAYEWHTDIYSDIVVKKTINNEEQAVGEYSNILEEWYQKLFTAGDAAAYEAIAKIATKAEETLASIPEDYTTTHNMAEEALRRKAEAIILREEGEAITVNDTSDSYLIGLNLYGKTTQVSTTGKNLLENTGSSHTSEGITYTLKDDGTVYATGTATDTSVYLVNSAFTFKAGVEYILTGCPSGGGTNSYRIDDVSKLADDGAGGTAVYTSDTTAQIRIRIAKGAVVSNLLFKPMIRLASISDPTYEPYSGGVPSPNPDYPQELVSIESPHVKIHGKNLCDITRAAGIGTTSVVTVSNNCATIAPNTSVYGFQLMYDAGKVVLKKGVTYSYSCDYEGTHGSSWGWRFKRIDGNWTTPNNKTSGMITPDMDIEQVSFYLGFPYNLSAEGKLSNVQIEVADAATKYEPYKTAQNLGIAYTLLGIPVTSGGNYTDANGQQWICDEIDFERGVLIRRIGDVTLNSSLTYKINNYQLNSRGSYMFEYYPGNITNVEQDVPVISDKLIRDKWGNFNNTETRSTVYCLSGRIAVHLADQTIQTIDAFKNYVDSNPILVMYAFANPIETSLTDEEIANFKMVCTNYPNTTVLNDSGARMAIKYNADTLIFLRDNQPGPTDEQAERFINAWLEQHFATAEGVSY